MHFRFSALLCAWATLVVVWVLELLVYVLGLLHIAGDSYDPEEIVFVGLFGGALISAIALLVLVIPLTLLARFVARRFRCHRAVPYTVLLGVSSLLAALVGGLELLMKQWHFDTGVFGCRVAYVFAGSSALWLVSRRHAQVV